MCLYFLLVHKVLIHLDLLSIAFSMVVKGEILSNDLIFQYLIAFILNESINIQSHEDGYFYVHTSFLI